MQSQPASAPTDHQQIWRLLPGPATEAARADIDNCRFAAASFSFPAGQVRLFSFLPDKPGKLIPGN